MIVTSRPAAAWPGGEQLLRHAALRLGQLLERTPAAAAGEKDGVSAQQKLGQLQPFLAVFPQECMGQLPSFGPT